MYLGLDIDFGFASRLKLKSGGQYRVTFLSSSRMKGKPYTGNTREVQEIDM
jgi:hypothetical protein